jgi:hypothetical protein
MATTPRALDAAKGRIVAAGYHRSSMRSVVLQRSFCLSMGGNLDHQNAKSGQQQQVNPAARVRDQQDEPEDYQT